MNFAKTITKNCLWALDILAEEGFVYDSSIYPIHHDLYGVPGARRFPYTHDCNNGLTLKEFPPATLRFMGTNFPVAGGGYLRIFPSAYTRLAFRIFEKHYGQRVVVYLHPWELDPEQPRIAGPLKSRLRHYTNLRGMSANVGAVLQRRQFARFCDILADGNPEPRGAAERLSSRADEAPERALRPVAQASVQQVKGNN